MSLNKNGKENKFDQIRAKQKEKIVHTAFNLLIKESFTKVSMKDIAKKARISRQTLYKYFPTIDDIVAEIEERVGKHALSEVVKQFQSLASSNGRQAIINMLKSVFDFGMNYPDETYFATLFDIYNRSRNDKERIGSKIIQRFRESHLGYNAMAAGMKDGSIRADIDAQLVSALLFNEAIAMTLRFAVVGGVPFPPDASITIKSITDQFIDIADRDLTPIKK